MRFFVYRNEYDNQWEVRSEEGEPLMSSPSQAACQQVADAWGKDEDIITASHSGEEYGYFDCLSLDFPHGIRRTGRYTRKRYQSQHGWARVVYCVNVYGPGGDWRPEVEDETEHDTLDEAMTVAWEWATGRQ